MVLIFHVSDLHFGAEDKAALDWFVQEAHTHKPSAIIVTGDLTMRARHSEFAAARDWLMDLPAPVSVEIGNHDIPYFNPVARFLKPYDRFELIERFVERPLELPLVEIIPMPTTARAQWRLNWSKGNVARWRLGAAVEAVRASARRHRLVACHHPLIDPRTRSTAHTRGGARALEALVDAGATAILSGHVHDPYDVRVEVNGKPIRLIGAGTLSERVRASPPSYNAIFVEREAMDVEIRYAA
jgi:3',5'-cyclic AMP phosphodiesterase CpdA